MFIQLCLFCIQNPISPEIARGVGRAVQKFIKRSCLNSGFVLRAAPALGGDWRLAAGGHFGNGVNSRNRTHENFVVIELRTFSLSGCSERGLVKTLQQSV